MLTLFFLFVVVLPLSTYIKKCTRMTVLLPMAKVHPLQTCQCCCSKETSNVCGLHKYNYWTCRSSEYCDYRMCDACQLTYDNPKCPACRRERSLRCKSVFQSIFISRFSWRVTIDVHLHLNFYRVLLMVSLFSIFTLLVCVGNVLFCWLFPLCTTLWKDSNWMWRGVIGLFFMLMSWVLCLTILGMCLNCRLVQS